MLKYSTFKTHYTRISWFELNWWRQGVPHQQVRMVGDARTLGRETPFGSTGDWGLDNTLANP